MVHALLVAGCGGMIQTYEGPKKAAQEIAVLRTNVGQLTFDTVWVDVVDDKKLIAAHSELEVSPGQHTLRVQLSSGFLKSSRVVVFDAKAGRTYRVKGVIGLRRTIAWIEEDISGDFVAGEKP
jgi:hypothetical protein